MAVSGGMVGSLQDLRHSQISRLELREERLQARLLRCETISRMSKGLAGGGKPVEAIENLVKVLEDENEQLKQETETMLALKKKINDILSANGHTDGEDYGDPRDQRAFEAEQTSTVDAYEYRVSTQAQSVDVTKLILAEVKRTCRPPAGAKAAALSAFSKVPLKATIDTGAGVLESAPLPHDSTSSVSDGSTPSLMVRRESLGGATDKKGASLFKRAGSTFIHADKKTANAPTIPDEVDPGLMASATVEATRQMRDERAEIMSKGQCFSSTTAEKKSERIRAFVLSPDYTCLHFKEDSILNVANEMTKGKSAGKKSNSHMVLLSDIKEVMYLVNKRGGSARSWEKLGNFGSKSKDKDEKTSKSFFKRRQSSDGSTSISSSSSSEGGLGVDGQRSAKGKEKDSPKMGLKGRLVGMARRSSAPSTVQTVHTNNDSPDDLKNALGFAIEMRDSSGRIEVFTNKRAQFVQWYDGLRLLVGLPPQTAEMLNELNFRVNLKIESQRYLEEAQKFFELRSVLEFIGKETARGSGNNINYVRQATRKFQNAMYDIKLSNEAGLLPTVSVTHIAMLRTLYDDFWKQDLEGLIVQAKAMMNEMSTVMVHKQEAAQAGMALSQLNVVLEEQLSHDQGHVREIMRRAEQKELRYFQELVGLQPILDSFCAHIRELARTLARDLDKVSKDPKRVNEIMGALHMMALFNSTADLPPHCGARRHEQVCVAMPSAGSILTKLRIWKSFMRDIVVALV